MISVHVHVTVARGAFMYKSALPGDRFGRLIVTAISSGRKRECLCDCGRVTTVERCNLTSGTTKSCGCLRAEVEKTASVTHGGTRGGWTPEYTVWHGMIQRCTNPRNPSYPRYGGRGISVSERWLSFVHFLEDMGPRPSGHSIDRVDNDGPYSLQNCVWAVDKQQQRNKRSNRTLTFRGKSQTIAAWAEELSIPYDTIYARLRRGWDDERALSAEAQHV